MKRFLAYSLLCLGTLNFLGCQISTLRKLTPIELVPSSTVVVLSVNWREVHKDEYLKRIVEGDELEKAFRELNISGDKVAELVAFSDAQNPTDGATTIILSGSYNIRTVINRLKTQGWTEQVYKGYKLYSNKAANEWLAPLKSGLLVVGTRAGVEEVVDVELNPQTGFASRQPFNRLVARFTKRTRYPISAFVAFPQAYQDMGNVALELSSVLLDFAGLGPFGQLLEKIGFAQGLGFSISRSGGSFPVELVAIMKDESAAGMVSGALNLLKELTTLVPQANMSPSDREAMKAFQEMSVDRDGEILSIKMILAEKDLMQ